MGKTSVIDDVFSFSPDFKKELSAIKKVNQVGKKLAESGSYIMYDGMLMGYETTNPHYSVSFLKDKVLDPLVLFMPHVVSIDGNKLYQTMSNGTFLGYEKYINKVSLIFEVDEEVIPEFEIEAFSKYATKHGLTDFDVIVAYKKGWQSNINVYDMYLKYMSILESSASKQKVKKAVDLQYTNLENDISKIVIPVIDEIRRNRLLLRYNMSNSDIDYLNDSDTPNDFYLKDCDDRIRYIRLMKNMFPTISSSSELAFSLVESDNEYYNYLLTEVDNADAVTINIFKVFPIIEKER